MEFAQQRPNIQRQHLQDFFNLKSLYTLKVDVNNKKAGTVKVNTRHLGLTDEELEKPIAASAPATHMTDVLAFPWQGEYFQELPLKLKAVSKKGYQFSHWDVLGTKLSFSQRYNPSLKLKPTGNMQIKAVYVKDTASIPTVYQLQSNYFKENPIGIKSAGYGNGSSFIESIEGKSLALQRGLTLVGLNASKQPQQIRRVDLCTDLTKDELYSFNNDIKENESKYQAFALIAHDSAFCSNRDKYLEQLFNNTGFHKGNSISYREPYIGIKTNTGKLKEYTGKKEEVILLEINNEK